MKRKSITGSRPTGFGSKPDLAKVPVSKTKRVHQARVHRSSSNYVSSGRGLVRVGT